jgi:hypothetical protein
MQNACKRSQTGIFVSIQRSLRKACCSVYGRSGGCIDEGFCRSGKYPRLRILARQRVLLSRWGGPYRDDLRTLLYYPWTRERPATGEGGTYRRAAASVLTSSFKHCLLFVQTAHRKLAKTFLHQPQLRAHRDGFRRRERGYDGTAGVEGSPMRQSTAPAFFLANIESVPHTICRWAATTL